MNENGQHENDQDNHGLYDRNEEVNYCGDQDDYEEGGEEDGFQYEDHYNYWIQHEENDYYNHSHHVESNDYCDGDNMEILTLPPSEILFSHDSIGSRFTNGIPLTCVFAHLINGSLKVTDIPMIEVLSMNGSWWTATGNRRLFLYRMLEEVGVIETINVAKSAMEPTSQSFKKHFTNACNGTTISCRQKSLQPSLNEIVADWLSWKDVVAKWDPLKQVLAIHENEEEGEYGYGYGYGYEDDDQEDEYYHNQYHYEYADDDQDDEYYQYDDDDDYYNNNTDESDHYYETDIHNGGGDSNCNQDEDDWDDYFSYNEEQNENDDENDGYCNVM